MSNQPNATRPESVGANAPGNPVAPAGPPAPGWSGAPPWPPLALGGCSILFALGASSLWGGIFAAINARRLGRATVAWRPLAIGGAALIGACVSYRFTAEAPWWAPPYVRIWMAWKYEFWSQPIWLAGPSLELFAATAIGLGVFLPQRGRYLAWKGAGAPGARPRRGALSGPVAIGVLGALLATLVGSAGQASARKTLADSEYRRGLECIAERQTPAAIEAFTRCITIDPQHVDALRKRAQACVDTGRASDAISDYARVAELRPTDAEAPIAIARLSVLQADYQAAVKATRDALARDPRSPTALFIQAVAHCELDDARAALEDIDRALRAAPATDPDRPLMHAYRGKLNLKLDRTDAAVGDFTAALAARPDNAIYLFDRGLANLQRRRTAEAILDFSAAIRLQPSAVEYRLARANALLALDRQREAADDCDHVLEIVEHLAPGAAEAAGVAGVYSLRARCRLAMGDIDGAAADAERAITLDAAWADGYLARGLVKVARGDRTAASADFDLALAHAAQDSRVYARSLHARGENRQALGDVSQGEADCVEARRRDPDVQRQAAAPH